MTQPFQAALDQGAASAQYVAAVARCITRAATVLRLDTRIVLAQLRAAGADPDFLEMLRAAALASIVDSALMDLLGSPDAVRRARRNVIDVLENVAAQNDEVITFAARVNIVTGKVVDVQ